MIKHDITAFILAGGKGQRMGGIDKGLVKYQGQPLVQWVISAVAPQVQDVVVIANRNRLRYQTYTNQVLSDDVSGFEGPVAGMLTGLRSSATPWCMFLPCDIQKIPSGLVQRLYMACVSQQRSVAVVVDGGQRLNTFLLIHSNKYDELRSYFNEGYRSIKGWLGQQQVAEVSFPEFAPGFKNMNTPDAFNDVE